MNAATSLKQNLIMNLKNLLSAEHQLLDCFEKLERQASNPRLENVLGCQYLETERRAARLDQISSIMNERLAGTLCLPLQTLISDSAEVFNHAIDTGPILDMAIIGVTSQFQHYQIATYQSAVRIALETVEPEVSLFLGSSLLEIKRANERIGIICDDEIIAEAITADPKHPQVAANKYDYNNGFGVKTSKLSLVMGRPARP
jgi:ferritin-like metal-binding protein YciE